MNPPAPARLDARRRSRHVRRTGRWILVGLACVVFSFSVLLSLVRTPPYVKEPGREEVVAPRPVRREDLVGGWDVFGEFVPQAAAAELLATPEGKNRLSPSSGAVPITERLVSIGRTAFYEQTFGNEVFLSEVVGILSGPLSAKAMLRAIVALHGAGTDNLVVELDGDATVGGRAFYAGNRIETGLDVPAGWKVPLGMAVRLSRGRVEAGITCAACHSTVDVHSGRVIEGAPNADLNAGLLLALAPNSAALFRQTGAKPSSLARVGTGYLDRTGVRRQLPDPDALEAAVDKDLLSWPRGSFDCTADLVNDPSQIPSSYTRGAHPYGWTGFAAAGWFKGLTINDDVHATNSDATTGGASSETLLGIEEEEYLGILLQRAANRRFRLGDDERPSERLSRVDPTPDTPGLGQMVRMPDFPKGSLVALDGLFASTPGRPFATELNGMSALQDTFVPPAPSGVDVQAATRGRPIFEHAGCGTCHSGTFLTNNRVLPWSSIRTEPARAKALTAFPKLFVPPRIYAPDTEVPIPPDAQILEVPLDPATAGDRALAFAEDGTGGYKVPSLVGVAWTAPYLHDGSIAAGTLSLAVGESGRFEVRRLDQLGPQGALGRGTVPDPRASLRALLDRGIRAVVVRENRLREDLKRSHVDGAGHEFWVDPDAGYSPRDQTDLIEYLISQ